MTALSWAARRDRAVDVAVAAACLAGCLGWVTDSTLFAGSPYLGVRLPAEVAVVVGAVAAVAALVRRRAPLLLAGAGLASWALVAGYPVVVMAQYALGAFERSRRAVVVATGLTLAAVAAPFWWHAGPDATVPMAVVVCVAPTLLGLYVGARRDLVASLRERAVRLERERHLLADQARADERTRIAHDMHDVVAHRVSLMVLHATALEVADDAQRSTLVGQIRTIGREALDELLQLVGVLKSGQAAPLAPQPALADVERLVAQSRAAGLPVDVEVHGEARPLPVIVEHAAYRVVQEALTNVHKHAGPAATRVCLRYGVDRLIVTVTNDRPATPPEPVLLPGGGDGLVGLRERVRLVGGELVAGPTAAGGFEVVARMPVTVSPA